jgi:hypothetical protein
MRREKPSAGQRRREISTRTTRQIPGTKTAEIAVHDRGDQHTDQVRQRHRANTRRGEAGEERLLQGEFGADFQ